uniref:Uncharacterized protein n=1 Tax=Eptatretus burgeri TaxID=7764 RepID=A0A8C4R9S8_EPTBU
MASSVRGKENGIFGSDFEWKGATGSGADSDDGGADGGDGGADGGDGDGGEDGGDGGEDGGDGGEDGGDCGEDGGGDDDGIEEGSGCNVGTMQLAWEMLELSKVLFLKREDKEGKLSAAQAYLKLGELGLETGSFCSPCASLPEMLFQFKALPFVSIHLKCLPHQLIPLLHLSHLYFSTLSESFSQAVEDLEICLALQSPLLAPSSRLLAQTHYQLGLALFLSHSFIPSALHFLKASHALSLRLGEKTKHWVKKTFVSKW